MKESKDKVGYISACNSFNKIKDFKNCSYSIIPSKILYNKELKANEKLLYAMITSLTCKEGFCFATNSYFAEELDVHPKTVSSWISDLRDKDFIKVELVRKDNKQIIQRKIYINTEKMP